MFILETYYTSIPKAIPNPPHLTLAGTFDLLKLKR